MTSTKYAHLQVMGTISGKFHKSPLKTVGGVAGTRTSVDKMCKVIVTGYINKRAQAKCPPTYVSM